MLLEGKMIRIWLGLIVLIILANSALAAVNINSANQAELESLKGIGPVKAKAIIDYRSQHGPFSSVDDLDKVKGIGKGTLDKIRKEIMVNGGATPAKPTRSPGSNAYLLDQPALPEIPAKPTAPAAPVQPVKPIFPATISVVRTGGTPALPRKGKIEPSK
jgi:competence protein ComEA